MAQSIRPQELLGERLPASADYCAVSTAARLIGDRWSLLLVRELATGHERFSDLRDGLPELSRSLLVTRLRYLEHLGVIERHAAEDGDRRSRHRYVLTEAGWGLVPALHALGEWALAWQLTGDSDDRDSVPVLLKHLESSIEPSLLPDRRIAIQFLFPAPSKHTGWLRVDRSGARSCLGGLVGEADLVVRSSSPTMSDLFWGRRTCREAIACRDITFEGPIGYAKAFSTWFPHRPAVRGSDAGHR